MLIGLIADTHDHIQHIQQAVDIFRDRGIELVIHAGDYCSPFTIPLFKGLPFQGVLGNNDGDLYLLMQKFCEIGARLAGGFLELEVDNRSLAAYHGTYQGITIALYKCGDYDVVISGHTHEAFAEKRGGTLAVNPGTAHGFDGYATIALLDTDMMDVEIVELT